MRPYAHGSCAFFFVSVSNPGSWICMDCQEPASMHYVIPLRLYGDSADAFSHDLMVPACAPLKALIALDLLA